MDERLTRLIEDFRLRPGMVRECSFAFSTKAPSDGWKSFSADSPGEVPFYVIQAESSKLPAMYAFVSGIKKESFIFVAELDGLTLLVMKKPGNDRNGIVRVAMRKEADFEKVRNAIKQIDLNSDILTAHSTLSYAVDLLKRDTGQHFVNLGLFSNYYLRNRMKPYLSSRGRNVEKEASAFFRKINGEIPSGRSGVVELLKGLGYSPRPVASPPPKGQHEEYRLGVSGALSEAVCVFADPSL